MLALLPTISIAKNVVEKKAPVDEKQLPDAEEFYRFFEKFNGFPISVRQKNLYDWKDKVGILHFGRQYGVTTFLLTLAAFEAAKGKRVVHVSSNQHMVNYCRLTYQKNRENVTQYSWSDSPVFISQNNDIRGRNIDALLMDCSGDVHKMYGIYNILNGMGSYRLMLTTNEPSYYLNEH